MLRSGLPIVRPRIRGNKHATLGYPASSQSEDTSGEHGFHFEMHHSGARTLPKVRAPPSSHTIVSLPQSRILERHHSMEIENNQNQNNIDENPIPLPPRDRSKTLQPKSTLPRHQRKHPLIIPGGGVTRTLAKMQAVTTPSVEDQVDGHFILQNSNTAIAGTSLQDNYLPEASANSPEEFEQRIDSELAALDSLPIEESRLRRCSMISEDLLEFSDNLIDCDDMPDLCQNVSQQSNDGQSSNLSTVTNNLCRKISAESKCSLKSFGTKVQENTETDLSRNPISISSCRPEDWINSSSRAQISPAKIQQAPLNYSSQTNVEEIPSKSEAFQCEEPLVHIGSNDNFHSTALPKAYRLSNEKTSNCDIVSDLSRQSDHVSCEDLLEFACDGPNTRRTRGPRNGEQSDEVRIMLKVLHESTPESCIAALNVTEWEILAAIKLEQLQILLKKENNFVGLEDCKVMLNQCGGDVYKAIALLRNTDDTAAV
ncbi:PREDICTED: tyrosine-protein kinase PR2-like [Wasmannia auropunctata]|uniref:tyrosine-protein kinase PR2-like n=1 Tax=Wasmannia auropunctata TaxID=64793 RepID=UPI0005F0421D|nr:PREDICTED: tyrosine-protein kinase PR2-like [Wasmannia auropunctata]